MFMILSRMDFEKKNIAILRKVYHITKLIDRKTLLIRRTLLRLRIARCKERFQI